MYGTSVHKVSGLGLLSVSGLVQVLVIILGGDDPAGD